MRLNWNTVNLLILVILILLAVSGCDSNKAANQSTLETIEGDLSFKLIDFGSFYPLADGLGNELMPYIDSLNNLPAETLSNGEKEFLGMVNVLEENDLLRLPSFLLRVDAVDYRVYVNPEDYSRISQFNRNDLISEGEIVKIQLMGMKINMADEKGFSIFRACEILSIKKSDGKTEWCK
ncbi:MAG: hypothetical protein HEP71_06065 [Roseivirga sp.]|nr:hypothetical protein [Roseivirga sp.]